MGLYRDFVVPRLCDLAMRNRMLAPYRARVIGAAEGRVLEIGTGSGMNLPLYAAGVTDVLALEPDLHLITMAERKTGSMQRPVTFLDASAESIPLGARSIDTVVTTWTLCTISDAHRALSEMRRVLRPGGHLLFVEHGRSPDTGVRKWQNRLDPLWSRISGGCHLNRPIQSLIEHAGFKIDRLTLAYAPGLKPMTYFYEGSAMPN